MKERLKHNIFNFHRNKKNRFIEVPSDRPSKEKEKQLSKKETVTQQLVY